uniref:FBA_2 domain-containing protein n=1 Tax=Steinernema glaseri TaxID=37863 RepID=A0A1I7Y695_9BILA
MDAVPLKFVDSVVELFGKDTLDESAREVRYPLWKDVVDLHHRYRVYYGVDILKEEEGIKHVFKDGNGEADFSVNMRTIRENRRFARIVVVNDFTEYRDLSYWSKVKTLGEAETTKLLQTVAPLIDPASCNFYLNRGSIACTKWLLTSLLKRAYLEGITMPYCGQISCDFLKDQINNSPFLTKVDISGYNWPKSFLRLITNFCLKGRPGKLVSVYLSSRSGALIHSNFIQNLLDLWRTKGNLHFRIQSFGATVSEEGFRALMNQGQMVKKSEYTQYSFFTHRTEKSVAVLSTTTCLMKCLTCECDRFEKCLLKEEFPNYHDF